MSLLTYLIIALTTLPTLAVLAFVISLITFIQGERARSRNSERIQSMQRDFDALRTGVKLVSADVYTQEVRSGRATNFRDVYRILEGLNLSDVSRTSIAPGYIDGGTQIDRRADEQKPQPRGTMNIPPGASEPLRNSHSMTPLATKTSSQSQKNATNTARSTSKATPPVDNAAESEPGRPVQTPRPSIRGGGNALSTPERPPPVKFPEQQIDGYFPPTRATAPPRDNVLSNRSKGRVETQSQTPLLNVAQKIYLITKLSKILESIQSDLTGNQCRIVLYEFRVHLQNLDQLFIVGKCTSVEVLQDNIEYHLAGALHQFLKEVQPPEIPRMRMYELIMRFGIAYKRMWDPEYMSDVNDDSESTESDNEEERHGTEVAEEEACTNCTGRRFIERPEPINGNSSYAESYAAFQARHSDALSTTGDRLNNPDTASKFPYGNPSDDLVMFSGPHTPDQPTPSQNPVSHFSNDSTLIGSHGSPDTGLTEAKDNVTSSLRGSPAARAIIPLEDEIYILFALRHILQATHFSIEKSEINIAIASIRSYIRSLNEIEDDSLLMNIRLPAETFNHRIRRYIVSAVQMFVERIEPRVSEEVVGEILERFWDASARICGDERRNDEENDEDMQHLNNDTTSFNTNNEISSPNTTENSILSLSTEQTYNNLWDDSGFLPSFPAPSSSPSISPRTTSDIGTNSLCDLSVHLISPSPTIDTARIQRYTITPLEHYIVGPRPAPTPNSSITTRLPQSSSDSSPSTHLSDATLVHTSESSGDTPANTPNLSTSTLGDLNPAVDLSLSGETLVNRSRRNSQFQPALGLSLSGDTLVNSGSEQDYTPFPERMLFDADGGLNDEGEDVMGRMEDELRDLAEREMLERGEGWWGVIGEVEDE